MKLNKTRQQMYLDGKVGLINDGTVEQLREVTTMPFVGDLVKYKNGSDVDAPNHHISWFYENETELPKVVRVDKATGGKEWYADFIGTIFDVTGEYNNDDYSVLHLGGKNNYLIAKSDCTPITQPTPTSYKLNIDVPEWVLKAGDKIELGRLPRSIMEYIATTYITFTLENGTQIQLTAKDFENIKKLQL